MFKTEAELVSALLPALPSVFPGFTQIEVEVGSRYGVADVVAAWADEASLERRAAIGIAPASRPAQAHILAALAEGARGEDDVCSSLPFTRGSLLREVGELERNGHIARSETGLRRISADPYAGLIAIEAKLDDWGRALCQARRYLHYADHAYLALPVDRVALVDPLQLQVAGVGLLAVGAANVTIVVRAPRSRSIQRWRRTFVAEVLVGSWASRTPDAMHRPTAFGFPAPVECPPSGLLLA